MPTLTATVILHFLVYDCNNGVLLYEVHREMPSYASSIEACREAGVEKAMRLAAEYRKTYPNASANVDCELRRGVAPTDPA